MEERKLRLTSGLSALFVVGCWPIDQRFFVFVKFFMQGMSGKNPAIPRVGRFRAAHGRPAGQGGAGQGGRPTDRFGQETTDPFAFESTVHNCAKQNFKSTNERNPIQTHRRTKTVLTSVLSAGRKTLFVPGCWPVDWRRLSWFLSYARHVREFSWRTDLSGSPPAWPRSAPRPRPACDLFWFGIRQFSGHALDENNL